MSNAAARSAARSTTSAAAGGDKVCGRCRIRAGKTGHETIVAADVAPVQRRSEACQIRHLLGHPRQARRPGRARPGRPPRSGPARGRLREGDRGPSYRTIKGILAAGTEAALAARPTGDPGAAAHLHGPAQLFADPIADVIALPIRAGSTEDAS